MLDETKKYQQSDYIFKARSPAEDCLEIAKIHHREAKQMFDNARSAEAEGRLEEAKLLTDLAVAREAIAAEFESTARGESSDPIVAEILDWQDNLNEGYVPYTPTFVTGDELAPAQLIEELRKPEPGLIARAVAWVGGLITR
jgi:hypothetical protein